MTAAVQDRDTQEVRGRLRSLPLEAATKIYGGTLAAVNAAGNLTKGATSNALKCVGVTDRTFDNSGGAAGAILGDVKAGVFGPFGNSAAGDAIANVDIGNDCYMVDDQTVAKTSNGAARSVAGKVWSVDANGVWVKFS